MQGKLTLRTEVIDLHELVGDVVAMLEAELRAAALQITSELGATRHHVDGDPVRCRQVLWNLLHNAIRNTPSHGQVAVRTGNETPGWLTITVVDTGRGIDAGLLSRIFEAFEKGEELHRRGVGLGLGLPITKAIVEAHGGRIDLTSEGHGHGTRVSVVLPTAVAPARRTAAEVEPVAAPQRRRILLVEDNEDSATALAEILQFHGYEVCIAGSVQDALRYVDEIDIVISDIGLPDGSGHELMRQISARRPVPGIALSGYGTRDDVRRSAEAGFERHIVKPVEPGSLLEALRTLG